MMKRRKKNKMSANQKIILMIFIVYLILNAAIGIIFSKRQNKKQHTSSEKKFFIGGRNMNGLLLAMTTMATYTSVSSFISWSCWSYLRICTGMDRYRTGSDYISGTWCSWK